MPFQLSEEWSSSAETEIYYLKKPAEKGYLRKISREMLISTTYVIKDNVKVGKLVAMLWKYLWKTKDQLWMLNQGYIFPHSGYSNLTE